MDEPVTPVQAKPQETTTTTATIGDSMGLQQSVYNAAALGWAIAELLGRSFTLKEEPPAEPDWAGNKLVVLRETLTPPEQMRAVMEHILYLADTSGVSSCVIEHENDPDNNSRYVDVLEEDVKLLSQHDLDATAGVTGEQLRGKINARLFYWDLKIRDVLQDKPTVVYKAYMVGRSLAALRWYFGLQDEVLDDGFMETIYSDHIPVLEPYVSPFAPGALVNSLEPWWKAISTGQVQPGPNGEAPTELQKQANVWYSLVIGERDALSYVPPTTGSRWYIRKVLRVFWSLFLAGGLVIILILAILLFVIISNSNPVTKEVTAVVALLTALGITHTVVTTTGSILQKAASEVTGTIKGSVIDNIRQSTQQHEVNKATFIPPAIANQQVAQSK